MEILVTGATGFIGRSLASALTRANIRWRAYEGRINDPLSLREQLEGVAIVVHLAGAEARGRNRLLEHVDIEGTERLLEEMKRANTPRLIYISRLGANPNAWQRLLQVKGEIENLIRRSGVPYTILRSSTLFGREDRFLEIILSLAMWSWPFVWLPGGGEVAMQPLWVEDLVRCILVTIERAELQTKTITVAGEERWRYHEIVRQVLVMREMRRIRLSVPLVLLNKFFVPVLFRWWRWPAVSRYFVDRFFVPEITETDVVLRHFGFRPARLSESLAYLHRAGIRSRLWRH
ncbi:MAG: NAD-dependent epimerase/dehydratase family protein [Chloroflexota bacterium]